MVTTNVAEENMYCQETTPPKAEGGRDFKIVDAANPNKIFLDVHNKPPLDYHTLFAHYSYTKSDDYGARLHADSLQPTTVKDGAVDGFYVDFEKKTCVTYADMGKHPLTASKSYTLKK